MTTLQATDTVNNTHHGYTYLRWQLIILGELEYVRMLDECHVDSTLGFFRFSEALAWTTIFPYVFFMMQSLFADGPKRDAQAAAYASLTVAFFTFGEFLTGITWDKVSDRLGRKPTLIIGVVRGSVSALAFGFSTNLWMALSARIFGGLVNPNVSVVSVCVGELVKRKQHQGSCQVVRIEPRTFLANTVKCSRQRLFGCSLLCGLWVSTKNSRSMKLKLMSIFRSLIGPVIGGHLADPVKTLPSIFREGTRWETFPYLLPNLIVILIIIISDFLGLFFLEESHPQMLQCRIR
jgi:MFS family permease